MFPEDVRVYNNDLIDVMSCDLYWTRDKIIDEASSN
jgi:hypothetical protein